MNINTERNGIGNIPRGRPRSKRADRAILDAATKLMEREGYVRMSMEQIAAEAGVTKATIYRRYAGKAELATAAIADLRDRRAPRPIGDSRADLVAELRHFRRGVERPNGMAMIGTVLAEEAHVPELLNHFRRDVVLPRRARLRSILAEAELRPGLDPDTAVNLAIGSFYASYLAGESARRWEARVADALLGPANGEEPD